MVRPEVFDCSSGGDDFLRFARPEDDQVVFCANVGGAIEAPQRVRIERQFEQRLKIAAFHGIPLGHGHTDDLPALDVAHRNGGRTVRTENVGDIRVGEIFQIVGDGGFDAPELFLGLREEAAFVVGEEFVGKGVSSARTVFMIFFSCSSDVSRS